MNTIKNIIAITLVICLFCFAKCNKEKTDNNGLPPATNEGKNTLGFLLNGQPWTPQGFNGTANLSIDVDFGINKGVFSISSYRIITGADREYFGLGLKDSLNLTTAPQTYQLGNGTLYGIYFSKTLCTFDYFDNIITRSGSLTITKFDKPNRIISGTFNAILSKPGCTNISITEGRFDMKY